MTESTFLSETEWRPDRDLQLPAYLYTDSKVFELEREIIFRHSWSYVGVLADLASPGSYVSATVANVPVAVTRGNDGELHGFVNACLHRLHPVVADQGCSKILQCKYHGWTYNLDGSLRRAPSSPHIDPTSMRLPRVRVETHGDFVFVNLTEEAPKLTDLLDDATDLIERLDFGMDGWARAGRFTYEIPGNWKLFLENALECYHCPLVHKESFAVSVATNPKDYLYHERENVIAHEAPIRNAPSGDPRPVAELDNFRFLFVWPSSAWSIDEYAGVVSRLEPIDAQNCRFVVDVFARPGVDESVLEEWLAMYDTTFGEDKAVVAAQQHGYDARIIPNGRVLGGSEPAVAAFQRMAWRALRGNLMASGGDR